MSYNGKFTSIKSVIDAAFRESGIDEIDYSFAIETAANLMGIMGIPDAFVTKQTNNIDCPVIEVSNYRAKLPDDLIEFKDMRRVSLDSNGKIDGFQEMIQSSDVYQFNQNDVDIDSPTIVNSETQYPLNELNEYDELETEDGIIVGGYTRSSFNYPANYKLDGNYIYTNFKDGFIEMVYRSYALSDDGYPMIPDDDKFREAVKFEIIYKLDWKKWRINPSPQNKSILNDSEQRRDWAVGAARTKARIPSIGQMEALKNQWLRGITKFNQHANGFKTNSIQEQRYNQSNRFNKYRGRP